MSYYAGKFYETLQKDLCDWVWNNPKLLRKITSHNLKYLFEFHPERGLSIDLKRFDSEYYATVFDPKENKNNIDEFVRKVCVVISQSLARSNRTELTITITVRHFYSGISHWKNFYIDAKFKNELRPLVQKEEDWYYI